MGIFDGTFILPPPPMRFNYCLCPPPTGHKIKSSVNPHNSFFFLERPLLKNWSSCFLIHLNNPQDPIWMRDTHRTAFLRRTTTYRITFSWKTTTHRIEKQPNPTTPTKNIVLCLQSPPYFFIWNSLYMFANEFLSSSQIAAIKLATRTEEIWFVLISKQEQKCLFYQYLEGS